MPDLRLFGADLANTASRRIHLLPSVVIGRKYLIYVGLGAFDRRVQAMSKISYYYSNATKSLFEASSIDVPQLFEITS